MEVKIDKILHENKERKMVKEKDMKTEEETQDEILRLKEVLEVKEKEYDSLLADFDNLKKRIDNDVKLRILGEKSKLILNIIEVMDSFDRAIESGKNYRHDPFFNGIVSIYRQLINSLREYGVEPIDSLGHEFDPNFHEAVGVLRSSDLKKNMVVKEIQKGYIMEEKLVRPSKVLVAL
ncbi:MAG: nucleotide exchange factor GrpE [Thermodesulfobacteriota bacterium]|nr:nucleotide exchange factor GrpE [Thermodesulfobacteriota bacterium]